MAVHNLTQGARSSALVTMGTLANGTFIASGDIDLSADVPLAITLEVVYDPNGTPTGNEQVVVFTKWSLDATNWQSGPESGTTVTEEQDLDVVGSVPGNDTNSHRRFFVVEPKGRYMRVIVKNDCGVALTDGFVYRADWTGEST